MEKILISNFLLFLILFFSSCEKNQPAHPDSHDFIFTELAADNDTVPLNGSTYLRAKTAGVNLSFTWSLPIGILEGSDSIVKFIACCSGDHPVTCNVSDGKTNIEKTINIYTE